MRIKTRQFLRLGCTVLGAVFVLAATSLSWSQNPPPPAPQPPAISPEMDPNAPGLSRQDRIKRQEAWIRQKLSEAKNPPPTAPKIPPSQAEQEKPAPERPNNPPPTAPAGVPGAPPQPPPPVPLKSPAVPVNPVYVSGSKKGPPKGQPLDKDPFGFHKVALYVLPGTVTVAEGESFKTEVRMLCMDKLLVDRLELVLKYQPGIMYPVAIHQDGIAHRLAGEPEWGMDREAGVIHYSAEFTPPIEALEATLIEVVWKALAPAEGIALELADGEKQSRLMSGGTALNENEFGTAGGTTGATVRILARGGKVPTGDRMVEDSVSDFSPALASLGSLEVRPPVLWLDYERQAEYKPDQWIIMDVQIENADAAVFDEVRLALEYDPEVLEIADTDRRNWIKTGVNILDGPFREKWDWDTHLTNEVNARAGTIQYRMSHVSARREASGVVARIVARIKKPAQEPLLKWKLDSGEAKPTTGVYLLGQNLFERYTRMNPPIPGEQRFNLIKAEAHE